MRAPVPHFQPKTKTQFVLVIGVLGSLFGICVYLLFYSGSGTDRDKILAKAKVLQERKMPQEAIQLLTRAVEAEEKASGPDSVKLVRYLDLLAQYQDDAGRPQLAEPLWRRLIAIRAKVLGPAHREVRWDTETLAMNLLAQSKLPEAEKILESSVVQVEKEFGPAHAGLMRPLNRVAELRLRQERHEDALALATRSESLGRKGLGLVPPEVGEALHLRARALIGLKKYAEALPLLNEAIFLKQAVRGIRPVKIAEMLTVYADLLRKSGSESEARDAESKAAELLRAAGAR